MRRKKSDLLYLQHKLPWETEWDDVDVGPFRSPDLFLKELKDEPPHLVETEYRVVTKKSMKLRNKDKSISYPVCIMNGSEIASKLKQLKRNE